MIWVLVVVTGAVAVELVMLLPIVQASAAILQTSRKSLHVISSRRISDCWKEKATQQYSKILLAQVLRLAFYFALFGLCLFTLLALADMFMPGFSRYMMSPGGMLAVTLTATLYFLLRKRLVSR